VTEAFAAINSKGRFLTVRKGSILAIPTPLKQFGLMEALCDEQSMLVFTRDIEKCAECVVPNNQYREVN
jgi:hypothetical protein